MWLFKGIRLYITKVIVIILAYYVWRTVHKEIARELGIPW